ncbi:helix-turn-helix domain-containing protein [Actinomadura kijaniata]|uniref:helix-turn-helix domain-containing protein n=1 Tax=Actinomadura kijaniata TaxID=46161 RepID=UPI003F192C42
MSRTVVAESPEFSVVSVRCAGGHSGWSPPEPADQHQVVLVRSGRFRLRAEGWGSVIEPATGYLQHPGDEMRYAHPAGGDACTAVSFAPHFWNEATDGHPAAALPVRVDGRIELAHRGMLRSSADASFALAEHLVGLLAEILRQTAVPVRGPGGRGRVLADQAREALLADHPAAAGLVPLARLLGVTPSHLSRVFRRETGVTLSRYRNRLRVTRALDRLEEGADDLAALAAELGFSDQAHLTRTMRAELGRTPAVVRRLLAP